MEQTGKRHHFVVVGYVVMPEHVHLLFREPEPGKPSWCWLRSKQTFARRLPQNLHGRINSKDSALWSTPFASWPPDVMRGTRPT
jgi:REP element-mobilizing transposase RayT